MVAGLAVVHRAAAAGIARWGPGRSRRRTTVGVAVDRTEVGRGIVVAGKGTAAVADRTEVPRERHWDETLANV